MKLLCSLVVQQLILLYLLSDGSSHIDKTVWYLFDSQGQVCGSDQNKSAVVSLIVVVVVVVVWASSSLMIDGWIESRRSKTSDQ